MYNAESNQYPTPTLTDSKLDLESPKPRPETKLPSLRELLVKIDESFQQERSRSLEGHGPIALSGASPKKASMSMSDLVHPPSYQPTEWARQHPLFKEFNSHSSPSHDASPTLDPTSDQGQSDTDSMADTRSDLSSAYSVSSTDSKKSCREAPRRYLCTICDKRFTRPSTLKTHLNGHTGQKPFACPNKGCAWRFTVLSNMKRHAKICVASQVNLPSVE